MMVHGRFKETIDAHGRGPCDVCADLQSFGNRNVVAVSQLVDLERKGHVRVLDMEVPWKLPCRCEP